MQKDKQQEQAQQLLAGVGGDPQQIAAKLDQYERLEESLKQLEMLGHIRRGPQGQVFGPGK